MVQEGRSHLRRLFAASITGCSTLNAKDEQATDNDDTVRDLAQATENTRIRPAVLTASHGRLTVKGHASVIGRPVQYLTGTRSDSYAWYRYNTSPFVAGRVSGPENVSVADL